MALTIEAFFSFSFLQEQLKDQLALGSIFLSLGL
jgi:hypothetical protein